MDTCMALLTHYSFFFMHPATPRIYTLSLHDALPILPLGTVRTIETRGISGAITGKMARALGREAIYMLDDAFGAPPQDRKSTRLNSSHSQISYAVFCLKKKKRSA